jgi:hypothetical protein
MEEAQTQATPTFERIVCGVDGTPESLVAVRQAVRSSVLVVRSERDG